LPICYLHAGTHKTGTSSVQAFLAANDLPLKQRGVLAPRSGISEGGSHLRLVDALLGKPVPSRLVDCVSKLKAELSAYPEHDVFLSAEVMENMTKQSSGVFCQLLSGSWI
jgi:hypothetical protein